MAIANVLLGLGAKTYSDVSEATLTAGDSSAGNYFGNSVSLSRDGNYLAVGAPQIYSVYIFTRSGSSWSQTAKITSLSGAGKFGRSVALNGTASTLIVGDDETELAVVYSRSGSSWSFVGNLNPIGGGSQPGFARAVAISTNGNYVAVGSTNYQYNNYVHFYSITGSTLTGQGRHNASDFLIGNGSGLGESVSLDLTGSVAAVGAAGDGKIIVFNRSGSTWTAAQALSQSGSGVSLGTSVAINNAGTVIQGGASAADSGNGAVYRFNKGTSSWAYASASAAQAGETGGRGRSVSTDYNGERLALSGTNFAKVSGGAGPDIHVSKPSGEEFGRQVSLSGDGTILAVGAPNWNSNRGRVYVYQYQ